MELDDVLTFLVKSLTLKISYGARRCFDFFGQIINAKNIL
jgi:hypothetical protein